MMTEALGEFWIHSVEEGAALRLVCLSPEWPDYFWAELKAPGLECRSRVSAFEPRPDRLSDLFQEMAKAWKGWKGGKVWQSLEGELKLTCTMDATGHVQISVRLSEGTPYRWR